jgi:UDP-glucose 4-epimerase
MVNLKGVNKMLTNCDAIVTGGAGFIGSTLVDRLLEFGNRVTSYDNFDTYYLDKETNIHHLVKNKLFKSVNADILDYETLKQSIKGVELIFHLAAQPGVRFSMEHPTKTTRVNVLGTLNVLKAAKEARVKRVIFASTSSVYGEAKVLPTDEKHPTKPISIYGASKLAAENYCQVFNDQLGLPVVMLRYHTVYGPRQRPDMAFHKWIKSYFEHKPITIYGDGTQSRDFTFVNDIVQGTIRAAEVENIEGEIFNLGGGNNVTVNDAVQLLLKELDTDDTVQIVYESAKLGDVSDTYASIEKARKMLDFNPNTRLQDGLKRYVEWYSKYCV